MRQTLTNQQMLAAARKRLAEHVSTRPASRREANARRQAHLDAANKLDARAVSVVTRPRTASEIGHGPDASDEQHVDGIAHSRSITQKLHHQANAAKERLCAVAWECDDEDMTEVWEGTRTELQERVDYYNRLAIA